MSGSFESIVGALRHHAGTRPDVRAYAFLDEKGAERASLTFAELDRRAAVLAGHLTAEARPGERALLVFPPGLDFIVAFFACQYAGIIAVPMKLPRRNRLTDSSGAIVADCRPKLALTTGLLMQGVEEALGDLPEARRIRWIGVDLLGLESDGGSPGAITTPSHGDLAFLQYTSGSTSCPKGVMVGHGNLIANLRQITVAVELGPQSTRVGWIPFFHDMGLIFNALQATYTGALCVLMAPGAFTQRPLSWLRAIHHYRAEIAVAPNFAFDLCCDRFCADRMTGVDLSCWKVAGNCSEPVRAETLKRFYETFSPYGLKETALYPSYGLAEATLMVTGGRPGDRARLWSVSREEFKRNGAVPSGRDDKPQTLVGCGKALPDQTIAIVNPFTTQRLGAGQVGEVWVHGPNIAQGYWEQPDATRQVFQAEIAGREGVSWLRTGDLGCLDETGELFITGRIKDVIIVRGANHYPQDIELTAERSHPALRPGYGAAFTVLRDQQEKLVIVFEVNTIRFDSLDTEDIVGRIRMSVVQEHDLTAYDVALLPPGTIPKTTSGKIRRNATRELWQDGKLSRIATSDIRTCKSP